MAVRAGRILAVARDTGRYAKLGWRLREYLCGWRDIVALMRFCLMVPLSYALCKRPPAPATFLLAKGPEVTISDRSELLGMAEVFDEGEYAVVFSTPPKVIVDLGANVGFAAIYFAQRCPDAQILAVEADPRTYERLVRNTVEVPNVTAVLRAITAENGTVTLYSSPRSMSSSLAHRSIDQRATMVPSSTLLALLTEFELQYVDLLKVDIEGAEYQVLQAAGPALEQIGAIVAEVHYDLAPDMTEGWLLETLTEFHCCFSELQRPHRYLLSATRR